jgi:hypothetical protein
MSPNASELAYVAWLRIAPGPWQAVARAESYAEAVHASDMYIAGLPDPPRHVEVFVGRRGTPPPTPRARRGFSRAR